MTPFGPTTMNLNASRPRAQGSSFFSRHRSRSGDQARSGDQDRPAVLDELADRMERAAFQLRARGQPAIAVAVA